MAGEARVVVGQAPGSDAARRIFLALQGSGVDEDDIKLAGDSAVRAQQATSDPAGKEQVDRAVVRRAARHAAAGAIVGGIAGVIVGAVVASLVVLALDGEWWWVLIGVAILGALGSVVGTLVLAERGMGVDDELELVLTDVDGPMWVAVRVRDDDAAAAIQDLFTTQDVDVVEEHTARARGFHLIEW